MPPYHPPCDAEDCHDFNTETAYVTRDMLGIRTFCTFHWRTMGILFRAIARCARGAKNGSCFRNHWADLEPEGLTPNSVRYDGKYWHLCMDHSNIYERFVDLFLK
jgi:hypothetical protein